MGVNTTTYVGFCREFMVYEGAWGQGLSQDFQNRVSKVGFQELRVSKIPDWISENYFTDYVHFFWKKIIQ